MHPETGGLAEIGIKCRRISDLLVKLETNRISQE
jgi:hypothetical protein